MILTALSAAICRIEDIDLVFRKPEVIFVSGTLNGLFAAVFLIATLFFGGMFLSGRVNKNDDVHITE